MKVIDPGHIYELAWLDGLPYLLTTGDSLTDKTAYQQGSNTLVFVKREGDKFPGNIGHHAGTNIQEVLRALMDRLKYLDNQIHDERNNVCIEYLRRTIWLLEDRAAERHGREFDYFPNNIELEPTCNKCGHIGCMGDCH